MTDRLFANYEVPKGTWDEFFKSAGEARTGLKSIINRLDAIGVKEFAVRQRMANAAFLRGGITFSVYSDRRGVEKVFPFDMIPRVVPVREWRRIEKGLQQRLKALNLFLRDVYGRQKIVSDGVVPESLITEPMGYIPQMKGVKPIGGTYTHIAGIDLVRDADGTLMVLEDNLRTPSGVSYVLENRTVMKRVLPGVFEASGVRTVREYPQRLSQALSQVAPKSGREPVIVVLTPGPLNSAYFEHGFLARTMGAHLVVGSDLFVEKDRVFMRTTAGPEQVDVIYKRIDDEFIDPEVFRKDSVLGVPGLFRAYAAGNVTLANAIGNGVADNKAVYRFVPDIIRYYLSEEPILAQVETRMCDNPKDLDAVLANLDQYVVKRISGSGGYGMLVGPTASKKELKDFAATLRKRPQDYIAQPRVELSACPTFTGSAVGPRRVDLRPFVVTGRSSWVLPGGLSRVALVKGSYVVNSSQGGGSKDTWVLGGSS